MEKFKTLNNHVAREIINHALYGNDRAVSYLLFNYRDAFYPSTYERLVKAVHAIVGNEMYNYPNNNTLSEDIRYYLFHLVHNLK